MTRTFLTVALASILALGCGRAALDTRAGATAMAKAKNSTEAAAAPGSDAAGAEGAGTREEADSAPAADARQPGDYVAYRFTGAFRKAPLTLTQRIVAREGDVIVVDLTLEAEGAREALRVRMSDEAAKRGEILGVARLTEAGEERPATLAAYERLMAKTLLTADANEAELDREPATVEVGGRQLSCQRVSYRVRIGGRAATLSTLQSDVFAWGDVGGEITAEDGRLLYRAEVIELGREQAGEKAAEAGEGIAQPAQPAPAGGAGAEAGPAVVASDYEE